jgi:hypothetical protein
MYCVVIHVLANTTGQICYSSDYMVEEVTESKISTLKDKTLDAFARNKMDKKHEREWYYGSVHNIFKL